MKFKHFLALSLIGIGSTMSFAQRFAVLSDIHVVPGNKNNEMLKKAVEEVNNSNFDMVIVNGDLTNEGSDEQLANVKSILDQIKHPLYVLPGNHENNWSQSATKTFVDLFGADRFVTEIDSLVVIGINCGPFMKMGDGHIKQEDLHWLKSTLDKMVTPGKRVLSFNHYPIRENDLDNWQDYADILLQYPVIGHINGHYHSWKHYHIGDIEATMTRALDMSNQNYGYTIVDIDKQWTHIYDKEVGHEAVPKYAYANKTVHQPLKEHAAGEFTQPEGFEITKVWADSASVFTRLAFDDKNVYFGNSLGQTRAVNKTNGSLTWSVPTGASLFSRSVVVAAGKVAVPTCDAILYLNAKNGKIIKKFKSKEGPYVADGLLAGDKYYQGGYKRVECFDAKSGSLKWTYDSLFNYCQAAPVLAGNDLIFGAWDTNLRCLDAKTGKLKWVWNNGKTANMLGPGNVVPVVTDTKVIVVAPDRYMTAVDRATGKQIWRDKSHRYRESLGVSQDGKTAYAKTMDGELIAVDTESDTFHEKWMVDMGLGYEHAPCVIAERDGIVYAGSRRGIVTAVDAESHKVIWSINLGVSEINAIDVDDTTGDIWVSLIEGTIYHIRRIAE
jgi:outer membrane protein assembly factor BamB